MICLDQLRRGTGTEIPKGLINSIDSIYSSLSALPTDITSMMSLVASLTGGISTLSVNTGILSNQIYNVSTNAFNSSVLTDYAKTSDIPTNTGGGGKYQYAFSELPSDANFANLYNITGDVGNMTFYSSDSTKTGNNLIMTMAKGYFNSNSIESYISSLYINNMLEFNNNTGYFRTLQLIGCGTLLSNSLDGAYLSLSKGYIKPNVFNVTSISCNYVTISSLSASKLHTFVMSRGQISSLTLNSVRNVDINCEFVKNLAFTGSGTYGVCNINVLSSLDSCIISNFSAANINCSVDKIYRVDIDSLRILNMNCTRGMTNITIKNVDTFNLNCGSNLYNGNFSNISIYNGNVPLISSLGCENIQTFNLEECNTFNRNSISNVKSLSMDVEYLGLSVNSTQHNNFTNITDATLNGYSMIYNQFSNIGNVDIDYSYISNNSYSTISNLNITCSNNCEKNGYSSILSDIHLSGHSFNSNSYSSFNGNLYVNCDVFGDYINHRVSVSNWDFTDLDNNWFNITASDYFGSVGGVKNVNISAMTFRGNVGAIENLYITAPVMTDQDQMIGLKNVNINCATCDSLLFLGNTDLNLNITISDSLNIIAPEGRMTMDLRKHETSAPGNIALYSDYFQYLELKMPESAKKDFTQLFNKDNYHTSSLWKTVSINLLNYIPKSDWMSYNTDLINSNICSWCGMPVSLLA